MGTRHWATCNKCGKEFYVSDGGGFRFEMLHCDKCGREKSVSHSSTDMEKIWNGQRIPCRCGGSFTGNAPPRCPRCKSTDFTYGGIMTCYD
jgi:DNA-directed RNA polymerase subunit M/transcription elongation factor TFIIS